MTIYLIDFENVSIGGLKGADTLGQNDLVFLFSSKNAARLTTATLATFNSTTLKFVEVPVKKQSLDMHLVSYLGYLIGTTDAEHFIIISNDHDYDNIMAFWRANGRNVTIERRGSIVPAALNEKPAAGNRNRRQNNRKDNMAAAAADNTKADTPVEKTSSDNKRHNNKDVKPRQEKEAAPAAADEDKSAAIKEALGKVYDESVCEDVLRIVASHSDEHNPLTSIHNDLRDTYEDPDYLDIYKLIKSVLSDGSTRRTSGNRRRNKNTAVQTEAAPEQTNTENTAQKKEGEKTSKPRTQKNQPNSDVTRINNEVQKILSKAKYETEIISHVAGLAAKSHGVKNGKMAIYRGIISKYGREKGLEIYDHLKSLLSDPDLWK
ncbi:MAG: hypothetical protein IKR23_14240 [Lachnospiraceae bacterium]|nr:hypothetical protein [Lachnospiraceae bacterium]